jgi:hypothetical protein
METKIIRHVRTGQIKEMPLKYAKEFLKSKSWEEEKRPVKKESSKKKG